MPTVVLRHPDLEVPTVVETGPDGLVPRWYADSGFTIDTATDPNVAVQEIATFQEAVAAKAAEQPVQAAFAPAVDAETGVPLEQTEAGQVASAVRQPNPSPTPSPTPAEPVETQE